MAYTSTCGITVECTTIRIYIIYLVKNRVIERQFVYDVWIVSIDVFIWCMQRTLVWLYTSSCFYLFRLYRSQYTSDHQVSFILHHQFSKLNGLNSYIPIESEQGCHTHPIPLGIFDIFLFMIEILEIIHPRTKQYLIFRIIQSYLLKIASPTIPDIGGYLVCTKFPIDRTVQLVQFRYTVVGYVTNQKLF